MSQILTMAEIEAQNASEWVLVEDPQTDAELEVVCGAVPQQESRRSLSQGRGAAPQAIRHVVYGENP